MLLSKSNIKIIIKQKYFFNIKDIDWSKWTTIHNSESLEQRFLDRLDDNFWYQHVDQAIRLRGSDCSSFLDLILTNEANRVNDIAYDYPLGKSDQSTSVFQFSCNAEYNTTKERHNYQKGDYIGMIDDLRSSTWIDEFKGVADTKDVEKTLNFLQDKILKLRHRFVPRISPSSKWIEKGCIPLDVSVRDLIKAKRINHRTWIKSIGTANEEKARLAFTKVRN